METKTEVLDSVQLELTASATVAELHAALQARLGWDTPERLERLDGFTDSWTVAVHKGREMLADQTLAECGLGAADEVIIVRRVLVPETWKILKDDEEDSDDSSDDDW
ncbi:hypothetical protein WJX81_003284 [Elliptochloris bilobata]|uniref:Ubiquitin-like domain-containing protein n=1 Tax=Elliptochloris bilobata TaxID=381761 RepID=A0AAW1QCN3_9CHLO